MLNKLDDIVISAFANKCIQIYKLTNNEADYLLVVDNCELKEDDCCNTYFVLLDNNYYYYFEVRIISEDELSGFLYMKLKKIY